MATTIQAQNSMGPSDRPSSLPLSYAAHEVLARVPPYVILDRIVVPGAPPTIKIALNEQTNEEFVAKRIIKWKISQRGHENYKRGLALHLGLDKLQHPGIARIVAHYEDSESYYLIMERMDSDIITLIEKRRRISENEARGIFRQVVETVHFIHQQGITHRDLKPDNFLIDFCASNNCVVAVKLTDFELAAELTDVKEHNIFCGSHAYAAPEICMKEDYDGVKTDIWSLGVMLYTMLCGEFPWNHFDLSKLFDMIIYDPFDVPNYLSADAIEILHALLTKEPKNRVSLPELLEYSWLSDIPHSTCEKSGHTRAPTHERKLRTHFKLVHSNPSSAPTSSEW